MAKKVVKPGTGTPGAQKVKLGGIDFELATADEQSEAGSDSDEASDFPDEDPEEVSSKSSAKLAVSKDVAKPADAKKPDSSHSKPATDDLEAELKDLKRDKERLQKKLDRLEAAKAENGVNADTKKLEAQLAELKTENAQLQQRVQDANASLTAATIAAGQNSEPAVDPVEFDDLKRDKARLERKVERLTKDLEEAKQKSSRSSTPAVDAAATKALEDKIVTLEAKVAAESKEKEELKKADKEWHEKEQKWKSDLAAAKSEGAGKTAKRRDSDAETDLTAHRAEKEAWLAERAELQANLDSKQAELDAFEDKVRKLKDEKKKLSKELDAVKAGKAGGKSGGSDGEELEELRERVEELTGQLEASKSAADKAKKDLDKRDKELKLLKVRVDELQEAADAGSSNSADSDKVSQLKEKLSDARQEAADSRRELEQLRKELDAARSEGPKVSASVSVKNAKSSKNGDVDVQDLQEQVAQLERHVAQMKLIEAAVYGAEPEYEDGSGFPTSVTLIANTLDEWGSLANKDNEELLPRFLHALKNSFTRSAYDSEMLAYWLSFACGSFAKFLKALPEDASFDEDAFFDRDILEQESKESLAEMDVLPRFFYGLAFVTFDIYSVLLINIYNQLDQILTGFVLQQHKNAAQLEQFPAILQNVLGLLRKNYIADKIVDSFMTQVFYFVDAQLFNALLSAPQLFTCNSGFQIKISLSQVESTLGKADKHLLSIANNQFGHIREAANLLAMDKSLVADEEMIEQVFSSLNVVQIKHIVDRFKPDDVSPVPVDRAVRKSLEDLCQKAKNLRLPLELEAMKISKINLLASLD
eukprot:TRINITY_DN563_c0_g1_i8.p1 TRINITY_DN563_c0_g1~~TRINITY_DN563_c0_g1_i8.p1  ORF type:complete len:818 (+),score=352.88 TRINITY_DN563_c0_g1_i8:572-3025(+)